MPLPPEYLMNLLFGKTNPRKFRREVKLRLRRLREKVKLENIEIKQRLPDAALEPIVLGRRVVLRRQVRAPVNLFSALHRLYKNDSRRATKLLSIVAGKVLTSKYDVYTRCAIQNSWDEHLKVIGQFGGILPPDQNLDLATQELFEQFYSSHRTPNDAEKALLEQVVRVDADAINNWFAVKHLRLAPGRALSRVGRAHCIWSRNAIIAARLRAWKLKKPLSRH